MPKIIAVVLGLIVGVSQLATGVAHAGERAGTATEDRAALLKSSVEMVRLMVTRESYVDSISQMSEQMLTSMRQQGTAMPGDAATRLKKAVMECLPYDEMVGWSAEVYATRFSLKELNDLISFYRTPTGQKLARSLPSLMAASGQKTAEVLVKRFPAAMKKYGLGPEGAGAAPPPGGLREEPPPAPQRPSKK